MTRSIDILERLIAFPTVSADSNLALIDYATGLLGEAGFAVHRLPDETGEKAGLFAALGPDGPGGVMLSGHTDVVPVTGQAWTREPFTLTDGGDRLYGRGTTDMKGFVACALAAAERAASAPLARPLKLALSYDEEVGCIGIPKMLERLDETVGRPDLCIVGEPTSMAIALGHKGKAALRAICRGTAGHSAMAPLFVNALHLACDFVAELRKLQGRIVETGARDEAYDVPYTTLHVGRLEGGRALNIVPDTAIVDFEFRHLAGDSADVLRAKIEAAAERIAAGYRDRCAGAAIEISDIFAYPGLDVTEDDRSVADMLALLPEAGLTKVAFGTEAGCFADVGVPALVCGPGNMDQGHKPDEFVAKDQLAQCDTMLDRVIDGLRG